MGYETTFDWWCLCFKIIIRVKLVNIYCIQLYKHVTASTIAKNIYNKNEKADKEESTSVMYISFYVIQKPLKKKLQ